MTIDQAVERVQFSYPQIYFACHTRHERRRTSAFQLSARDSAILVHLDRRVPMRVTSLARHLDLAASTLSEAISRLEGMGYVAKASEPADRRAVTLTLTPKGADAVRGTSVLEPARVAAVLRSMAPSERRRALDGLELFARACRQR